MPHLWRALRRRALTPSVSATRLAERGFHAKDDAARERLEKVGLTFVTGFGYATESRDPAEATAALEGIEVEYRGFGYEGATMGFAIMNGLGLGGGRSVGGFLAAQADQHTYMAHIGIGWAMARLPAFRWRAVAPTDPVLRWLALDGYGFHQAYFHTQRYVREQYQDPAFRWPPEGPAGYANRVIDQGIGRALWFVEGTEVPRVVATINAFPAHRRADLFSGAGLAATYAGGADGTELRAFWHEAGEHQPVVAQACAFAAKARVRADLVTAHTWLATSVFCRTTPPDAAAVTDTALAASSADGELPAFEIWRQHIAAEFVRRGVCDDARAGTGGVDLRMSD
jgi:enediyne biosynthesis protein E3